MYTRVLLFATLVIGAVAPQARTPQPALEEAAPRFDHARLPRITEVLDDAVKAGAMPGAVVAVGDEQGIVWQTATGRRAVRPEPEVMTADTVFDIASLTKPVATTTAVMMLVEDGRLRLNDRVAAHVPGFEKHGKRDITVRHLMTHTSGLRPDVDMLPEWSGHDRAIELALAEVPVARPDERFIYSDINYFLLGHIVGTVSGQPLDVFTRERIFQPLGMHDTMFNPPAALRARIAPTERCTPFGYPCTPPGGSWLRGIVHDPTARRMAGVAGHAGLFSTAADLSRFCRMLLNGGTLDGVRILSPLAVERMTRASTPIGERNLRGLGWDIDSTFSANRGDLLPLGSFGHTGFTGTSLWIDPHTSTWVVFLSNRVHPDGKGDVTPVRARVATVAASAIASRSGILPALSALPAQPPAQTGAAGQVTPVPTRPVLTGIDVLRADNFAAIAGRRVGLLTNHTGRARDGATTIDLLHGAADVSLVALFSPEHGIRGILDTKIPSSVDDKTGLVIHSLYGDTRRPTADMLQGIDTMVVDLQDIGSRFYTYMASIAYVMEEAAPRNIEVVVLDRPNPINGWQIEGPIQDASTEGFTAYFPMPVRHGLTLGELASLFNEERRIGARLTVIEMQGWRRDAWWDETGLLWINPSPNMRNLWQATMYPGIGAIEFANVSVGRGTDGPFQYVGAPWVDGVRLAETLNAAGLPGIRFYPVTFTPSASKYAGEECGGVYLVVTDRQAVRPVRVGLELVSALSRLFPGRLDLGRTAMLYGSAGELARAMKAEPTQAIAADWAAGEARWRTLRAKYLRYP
jgi:uncharacterized protein YbbC (DUF1343 family)/CubicO group peptidase (beta-lactamase class C family)